MERGGEGNEYRYRALRPLSYVIETRSDFIINVILHRAIKSVINYIPPTPISLFQEAASILSTTTNYYYYFDSSSPTIRPIGDAMRISLGLERGPLLRVNDAIDQGHEHYRSS
jgi:hypothetical protein